MMNPEQWKRVREALEQALSLEGAERADFMDTLQASDEGLAGSVRELLERDTESDVEDVAPRGDWSELFGPASLAPGTRLGAYEITAEIASGGMGTVYRGRRADAQFEKSVAIKLIKRGMDSAEILERFRYERQVLAELEHPGIARLLDGGVSEDGQPYFVLEYVEGQPIDLWCESRGLGLRERLELFQRVCQAVHYAHQHLVVHRDLKPGNILVSDAGEPKLLDFGIARMLDPESEEERSQWTAEQGFFGTPSFASPEQLRGERVTTATDVYSLGVVLYRLLTGRRPHELSDVSREEARRLVCEVEPTRPSRMPVGAAGSGANIARGKLAGDLDNIVLMALRKEPERRYASAEQFSEDLQRHLDGLPVIARPNTLGYRAGKFLGRNRVSTLVATALVVSLIAGVVTSSRLYVQASEANAQAQSRFEDVRRMAATFIFDVSGDIGPLEGSVQARERIVSSALEYLNELASEAHDDPEVVAELARAYLRLGDLQGGALTSNLGQRDAARASYEQATLMARRLQEQAPESAEYAELRARCLYRQADLDALAGDTERALERLEEGLALCPQGSSWPQSLEARSIILGRMGDQLVQQGEHEAAAERFDESVEIQERLLGLDPESALRHRELAVAYNKLSEARLYTGDVELAEELCLEACEMFDVLLDSEEENAELRQLFVAVYFRLGSMYLRTQRLEEALEPLFLANENALLIVEADPRNELARRNYCSGQQTLGMVLSQLGRNEEALEIMLESHSALTELRELDPTSLRTRRDLAISCSTIAGSLIKLGRLEEALEYNERAREEFEALRDADPERAEAKRDLAACLTNIGAYHMSAAKDAQRPLPERREHAAGARECFQGALDEFVQLQDGGKLAKVDEPYLGMLAGFVEDASALGDELEAQDTTDAD